MKKTFFIRTRANKIKYFPNFTIKMNYYYLFYYFSMVK